MHRIIVIWVSIWSLIFAFLYESNFKMTTKFSILTVNVRGTIKDSEQRGKLQACVELNNINIVLLQETHVCSLYYKRA